MLTPLKIIFIACMLLFQVSESDAPEFPGQPKQCDNMIQTPAEHRCHCARDEQKCHGLPGEAPAPVAMDRRCLTYCRQQKCTCMGHGCRS